MRAVRLMSGTSVGAPAEVEVFAPARADLAGGTLDLWPLYCLHPGAVVVSTALGEGVRLRAWRGAAPGVVRLRGPGGELVELSPDQSTQHLAAAVTFALLPHGGVQVEVGEQLPVGSGLGGSSVLAVALARACLALAGRRAAPTRLVALLKDLEAGVLQAPTGCQDYYPALVGGTLAVQLVPGGEVVRRLPRRHRWVERRLAVIYTGISHHSGLVNWEVYRRRVDGDAQTASALAAIAEAARACHAALLAGDEVGVGRAIAAEWRSRRRLAPEVSSQQLERVIEAGVGAGALAGKACGAGGGGSVLLWSAPQRREPVAAAALAAAGPGARRVSTSPRPPSLSCKVALA